MLTALDDKIIFDRLLNYIGALKENGHVNNATTCRFMTYMFLYDFVETLYDFLTEADYKIIDDILISIFSAGDCLLPYEPMSNEGFIVGKPIFDGFATYRQVEDESGGGVRPVEENDNLRIVE